MQTSDLEQVHKIEQAANELPWSKQEIENLLETSENVHIRNECWLAYLKESEHPEHIIAYALVSTVLDESSLLNFCVDVAYQRRGYGKNFLQYLLKDACKKHRTKYFLEVRESNSKAIKLYESFGFHQDLMRADYYPTAEGRENGLTYSLNL